MVHVCFAQKPPVIDRTGRNVGSLDIRVCNLTVTARHFEA